MRLRRRFQSQPLDAVEVDWSHPLARGLRLVWLNKRVLTPFGELKGALSGADASPTVGRLGLGTNYGQSGLQLQASPLDEFVNADQTYLMVGSPPPAQSWCVGVSTGSGSLRKWSGNFVIHSYPSGVRDVGMASQWSAEAVVVAQIKKDLSGARMFVNGALAANQGYAAVSGFTAANAQLFQSVAGDRSSATYWAARTFIAAKWDRYLADEEAAQLSAAPWLLFRRRSLMPRLAAAAGGLILPVGLASESSLALGLPVMQIRGSGLSADSGVALALLSSLATPAGVAVDTHAALALAAVQVRAVGLGLQAEAAFALAGRQSAPTGLAVDAHVATAASARQIRGAGLATEAASALALLPSTPGAVGLAIDGQASFALPARQIRAIGLASQADAALALSTALAGLVGVAVDAQAAQALKARQIKAFGLAPEVALAYALPSVGAPPTAGIRASLSSRTRLNMAAAGRRPAQLSSGTRRRQ